MRHYYFPKYPISPVLQRYSNIFMTINVILTACILTWLFVNRDKYALNGNAFLEHSAIWAMVVIPHVFYFTYKDILREVLDRKYAVLMKSFSEALVASYKYKPTIEESRQLDVPAQIHFTRVDKGGELDYLINNEVYTLNIGESVTIITKQSVNAIEINHKRYGNLKLYELNDGEEIFLQYAYAHLISVKGERVDKA